jgi:phosphoglycerol transferase MdoB-like AlkP superfamily enzyme
MKVRVSYLLETYLLTVLLFIVAKVAFMLCNASTHPFTVGDVFDVATHGLTLDLSTSLYCLIVPFLLSVVSLWTTGRWLRRILTAYHLLLAVVLSLAFVADTSLYPFWGFKLDASCLQYLETPTEAMASVSSVYIVVRLVVLLLVASLIFAAYQRTVRLLRTPSPLTSDSRSAYFGLIAALLLVPVFIIGIRGGLDESTTNIGQVYFSQNQFLNHSAINPVFSFLSSFEKTASHIVDYDYYSQQECDTLMAGLYPATRPSADTLLSERRPDIVIILMESAGEVVADAMPRLQRLKREGINFSRCYGNTWRTDRGTVCALSGYPSFPTSSVMKMTGKTRHLPSIARTLGRAGYETSYFYGGDINFTNMRGYLVGAGFSQLTWKKDFTMDQQNTSKWGVRDDIMFDAVTDYLLQPHDRPQLIGFSTLSSHEPWDVPIHKLDEPIKNSFYYLDDCIHRMMERLRQSPRWQQTLVILLPDHSIDYGSIDKFSPRRDLIPMLWVGGAVRQPRDISVICNQTDLAATLLAQLGLPHDDFLWSRDVLSPDYTYPLAVHNYNNGFSMTDSTGFMVYDLDVGRTVFQTSADVRRLERIGKAILQATTRDLKDL